MTVEKLVRLGGVAVSEGGAAVTEPLMVTAFEAPIVVRVILVAGIFVTEAKAFMRT